MYESVEVVKNECKKEWMNVWKCRSSEEWMMDVWMYRNREVGI